MPKRTVVFATEIEKTVGEEIKNKVMHGYEEIDSASPVKQAAWWKSAMDRMDQYIDESTRIKVMEQCGYNCGWKRVAEIVKKARKQSKTMDDFFENLQTLYSHHPMERDGFTIYISYTKCYCGRVKATKEAISLTHCHCSKGFFLAAFESGLGRPVPVDLLQSIINGANSCKFAIRIPIDEFP